MFLFTHLNSLYAQSQNLLLVSVTAISFGMVGCKRLSTQSKSSAVSCDPNDVEATKKQIDLLVQKEDQTDFLEIYHEDLGDLGSPQHLSEKLKIWKKELDTCESGPGFALLQESVSVPFCGIEVVSKAIATNVTYGFQKIKFAPYRNTLKFKKIEGKPRLFVKRKALSIIDDPRQPFVIDGYENAYHWIFRKGAGDLHPAFLAAEMLGKKPYKIKSDLLNHAIKPQTPDQIVDMSMLKKYEGLVEILESKGYLEKSISKSPRAFEDPSSNLRIVNPNKIGDAERDTEIIAYIEKAFKAEDREKAHQILMKQLRERIDPPIKNREITAEALGKLEIDIPNVTLFYEDSYFYVQLLDHHRIYGAQGLGMSIEVNHLMGQHTFN